MLGAAGVFGYWVSGHGENLAALAASKVWLSWGLLIGLSLFHAAALAGVSKVIWISGPLLIGAWGAPAAWSRTSEVMTLVMVGYLVVLQSLLLFGSWRKVLSSPKHQWWTVPLRLQRRLKAKLWPVSGGELESHTLDLSETGAFLSWEESVWAPGKSGPGHSLKVGSHGSGRIHLDKSQALYVHYQVVREAPVRRGRYPAGIGVRFVGLSPADREVIRAYLKKAA